MEKRSNKPNAKPSGVVLGRAAFEAITAVEGLELTAEGKKRISKRSSAPRRYQGLFGSAQAHEIVCT